MTSTIVYGRTTSYRVVLPCAVRKLCDCEGKCCADLRIVMTHRAKTNFHVILIRASRGDLSIIRTRRCGALLQISIATFRHLHLLYEYEATTLLCCAFSLRAMIDLEIDTKPT
jgi:hypothetical protein